MAELSIETKSKYPSEKIMDLAVDFFTTRYGLEVNSRADCCLELEGGGGYVAINTEAKDGYTLVNVEGREWSFPIGDFVEKIAM
ncbi:hypothetical protein KQH62_04515 [bacterium]|nr:hypothetical protein [bacterium]